MKRSQEQQLREAISEVLWEQWDPIGVRDNSQARNEYDGYVSSILKLLRNGASEEKLMKLLRQHETVNMGLRGSSAEHLRSVVLALLNIWARKV